MLSVSGQMGTDSSLTASSASISNNLSAYTLSVGSTGTISSVGSSDNSIVNKKYVDDKSLPTTSTAGKVLKSTSTAGVVEWGDAGGGGGGAPIYRSDWTVISGGTSYNAGAIISLSIIDKEAVEPGGGSASYTEIASLFQWLYNHGYTADGSGKFFPVSGKIYDGSWHNCDVQVVGIAPYGYDTMTGNTFAIKYAYPGGNSGVDNWWSSDSGYYCYLDRHSVTVTQINE